MRKIIFSSVMIEYENLKKVNEKYLKDFQLAFDKVMESGYFILGRNVDEFEKEFALYNDSKYCTGVASGLDALTISLMSLGFPKGSEVIVPSNTYIATIISVILSGNIPVLVEPDIKTYNIDPQLIEDAVTPATRAIIAVHLYGKPCQMNPILEICRRKNLFLIEDCAQAHGAEYKGKKVGTFGDFGAFSFYPTKNLGCLGDGGAILTDNHDLYEKARMIRNYGSSKKYFNDVIGLNSRLDELQAAFLRVKLKDIDNINSHKRSLAAEYHKMLKKEFILPDLSDDCSDVFHIFNIRHKERDTIRKYLLENNIKTEIHYPLSPHRQRALSGLKFLDYPISDEIHNTTLSLPVSVCHSVDDIKEVIYTLNRYF